MDTDGLKLRILLLGPPVVYFGNQKLRIQRRLLRTLLYYLAGQTEPVGRSALMNLFWPELEQEESRRRLREMLSKLRTQLPHPSILVAEQDYVCLDPQQTYVDVLEYQALLDQVRFFLQRQSTSPLPEAIYQQMYKAIHLWRSPEFLAGVNAPSTEGLDRWISLQSQSLDFSRQNLLEALADHSANSGDLQEAVYWVRRALEMDDENPDLHYRLISWLRNLGKRNEALNMCEQARKIFENAGATRLPPPIVGLYHQIQGEADLPAQEAPVPWHHTLTLQLPFVGRKKLLAELKLAMQRGGVDLIWGEAGAGKSRLTFEFYQSLEPAPRLLLAAGHSHLMEMPYQPLIDSLRHAVTVEEWKQLDSVWADQLSLLLPELLTLRPGTRQPEAVSGSNQRQKTAETFFQIFKILARRQRLLVFLDDAQWADAETFEILAYLLDHKLFATHGLLVIAARPEEPNDAFTQFLSQSQVAWNMRQSQLELLFLEEIAELTRLALGKPAPDGLIQRLALDTGGNPLFLLETLRALMEFPMDTGQLQSVEHLPLASSIRALVRERLRLLDPNARQALSSAAVIGNPFTIDILIATTELDSSEAIRVLEAMETAHLVRPVQIHGELGYAFIHEKIREVLLFELSQARRQNLHLRAAQAMESKTGEIHGYAAAIAYHYEEAGNLRLAFQYWLQAGEYSRIRQKRVDALAAFQRAESILTMIELQVPTPLICQLYTAWGDMACEDLDSDQAEYSYAVLLRYGEQRYAPLLVGIAYKGLARVAGIRDQPRLALAHLDHAIPFLAETDNPYDRIEASRHRAVYLHQLHRYQESADMLENVLYLGNDLQDYRTRQAFAEALVQLGLAYLLLGETTRCQAAAQRLMDVGQKLTRPASMVGALALLAITDYLMADFEAALHKCDQAFQLAEDIQDRRLVSYLYSIRGNVFLHIGHLDKAWQDSLKVLEVAEAGQNADMLARGYCIQGDLWRFLQDYPAAIHSYQRALDASHEQSTAMELLFRLGLAFALNGQIEKGFPLLNQAVELCRETHLDVVRLPAELAQAVVYLLSGQTEIALKLANDAEGQIRQRGLRLFLPGAWWISGMAAALSKPEEARGYALSLVQTGEETKSPWVGISALEILILLNPIEGDLMAQKLLDTLCAYLSPQCRNARIQPVFAAFCEKMFIQTAPG